MIGFGDEQRNTGNTTIKVIIGNEKTFQRKTAKQDADNYVNGINNTVWYSFHICSGNQGFYFG